jgi:hypothetical protein
VVGGVTAQSRAHAQSARLPLPQRGGRVDEGLGVVEQERALDLEGLKNVVKRGCLGHTLFNYKYLNMIGRVRIKWNKRRGFMCLHMSASESPLGDAGERVE